MITVVERIRGHYDVEEVEFGRIKRWCPERIVARCECGETVSLTASSAACRRCGSDLSEVFREEPPTGGSAEAQARRN